MAHSGQAEVLESPMNVLQASVSREYEVEEVWLMFTTGVTISGSGKG